MKVILVGDATSGKSTFLKYLADKKQGFNIFFEEGWQNIPPEVEANKFKSNLWFIDYFYQRDKKIQNLDKVIVERELYFQYPFTEAQYQTGLIIQEQKQQIIEKLNKLTKEIKLNSNDLVLHFICDNKTIRARLAVRGLVKPADKDVYWDILRKETEKFFKGKCLYKKIDTTNLSIGEVQKIAYENITQSL